MADLIVADVPVSHAAFRERVRRAVAGFSALGVRQGARVALLLRNDAPFLEASLALQHLGAYAVPLNWHSSPAEIGYICRDCSASVLVAHADLLTGETRAALPGLTILRVEPREGDAGSALRGAGAGVTADIAWDEWLAGHEPDASAAAMPTESLIYTSGTTGRPKGVQRAAPDPANLSRIDAMRGVLTGIGPSSRVLVTAPLYHTAPNVFAQLAIRKASLLVLPRRFDAEDLLARIERHRVTNLYAVATMLVRLLAVPAETRRRYDLSSLEFVLLAGGPCAPEIKRRAIEWLGPVVNEYYGSTENGPMTFCSSADWLRRPGTVGRPVECTTVSILDEDGRALGPGRQGEICVASSIYTDFTYLNQPEARAAIQRGSFVATGDIGYTDEDGFLYICDRKKDLVISGGVNIYPAEIEAALMQLPGIADCAVFGVPDAEFGEALAAVVELHDNTGLAEDDIARHLAANLPRFKVPKRVEICAALPREESGKIRKRVLREPYWAGMDSRI